MARPPELLYAVDETPPPGILVVSALQHLAVIAITLIFPLILGAEAHLDQLEFIDLVSMSMLAIGCSTILLCIRYRFIGSGYLCPSCFTAIFLGPSLFALRHGGLGAVFGMTIVAGIVQVAIAPILRRLRALMPSEIAGLVIAIVGLSLAALGVHYMLGFSTDHGISQDYLIVSAISLATMTGLNVWGKGYAKMFCVLIGMAVGYLASAALGVLNFSSVIPTGGLAILRLPRLDHISYSFDPIVLAPFIVAAFASTVRVMGDVTNCQRLNDKDWVRPNFATLAGGVTSNGLASVLCGLAGTLGPNSYSSCIGLSAATGITSRVVGIAVGIAFIVLALVPSAAVLLAAMPKPVMGAALFFTAAFVFTSGMQMITARMLDARKTLVIGFSFAMAVIADTHQAAFAAAPPVLQPILGNSLVLGTMCAVFLNLIMRLGVRQQVTLKLNAGSNNREAIEQFLSAQGARWAARRDVINRAIFGAVQVSEVIGDLSGVEIQASFDEYNLDLSIRYAGAPLVIPEKRPTPKEIVASDEGERLLAGYLLRQSADSITSEAADGGAEVNLHYDH